MSLATAATGLTLIEWLNSIFTTSGVIVSVLALIMNRRSVVAAERANSISREATELAKEANRVAERTMQLQADETKVRLVVKPRMLCVLGDGEDTRPRPVVEVINLSSFSVTVQSIHWRTTRTEKKWLFWKNPTISSPYDSLPARLPPRESLTAIGTATTFAAHGELRLISAAVAITACGEKVEGLVDADWSGLCDEQERTQTETTGLPNDVH
jgi:hypothetical protein